MSRMAPLNTIKIQALLLALLREEKTGGNNPFNGIDVGGYSSPTQPILTRWRPGIWWWVRGMAPLNTIKIQALLLTLLMK
ncbi:MAG: hypothetical protein H0A76_01990 [Candidatus Thiodubiliella endoseptemdiera]|uniref:Uncharacterized protein n=1 Tax=Candidatus Thiodubiliella endoseptemdiera TaxID=2738886 RepID=A0A853F3E6_9GAMM|nr:hypothetical protein [Candidatus Thiodubiliella endoseptemdiera]